MNLAVLEYSAYCLRIDSIRATTAAGSGHPTSCLSAADILAVLFFEVMRYNPKNPQQVNNDRFILSKGHAAPLLYAVFKQLGVISDEQLLTLREFDSVLEGHPTKRFYYTEAATGSLGCGLSIGLGMALAAHTRQQDYYTYVLLGDSECTEGSVWEAVQLASYYKTHRLIAIVDVNRLGQTGQTVDGHVTHSLFQKFHAFGWHVLEVDGHDIQDLGDAFKKAQTHTKKPTVILAKTFKGYGVDVAQDRNGLHGKIFKPEVVHEVLSSLKKRFSSAANYSGPRVQSKLPSFTDASYACTDFLLPLPVFDNDVATRQAYGQAVTVAGSACPSVVCLDAEVNNSTGAHLFAEQHPNKFFQCFIAEQNMIGMAVGFAARGMIPFVSTFGAFFSRAFDQIRMAAIGKSSLRLVGSHCGVSIGQDGPSQMALEDIAMMRTLPGSIILYPCDAVSTFKLVQLMAGYHKGISYLRTTREKTKTLYKPQEKFEIGGCKVLKQNDSSRAVVVAAGVTVHEALKAAELLQKENIFISVIDLYCIKPLDTQTLVLIARASANRVITVEDHYLEGGLGQAVVVALANYGVHITVLAVKELPRSGSPEELREWAGIDAQAIMQEVKKGN